MAMGKRIFFVFVFILSALVLVLVPPLSRGSGIEKPAYTVVKEDKNIEIREYQGYILAQVNKSMDFHDSLNAGFMDLFHYISGHNTNRSKISMTVPVIQERTGRSEKISMTAPVISEKSGDHYTISFIMPHQYTMETLPVPDNKNITFSQAAPYRAAVIHFSGRMDEALADKKLGELQKWIGNHGLKTASDYMMAQYDPPWIPGFMRKNEIIVKVE